MTGAYEFICKASNTDQLCASLNALEWPALAPGLGEASVKWRWAVGDSYWYGDYVMCRPFPGVRIRIVDFPIHIDGEFKYDADVRLGPECKTSMEVIDHAFRGVLAALGAHDVKEIEPFD